jgi:polysaccharide export outer membrane protein
MNVTGKAIAVLSLVLGASLLTACTPAANSSAVAAGTSATSGYSYQLSPGDRLNVFVWRNPDLSVANIPVTPDGRISAPLVQDMQAAGKTPDQLAKDITAVLQTYIKDPLVTVTVADFATALGDQRVRVSGEVKNPQILPYRSNMTILDAMIAVGGMTEFAAGNRAMLVRDVGGGKQQSFRVRVADLVRDGDISANLKLQPGDVLIVPESIL